MVDPPSGLAHIAGLGLGLGAVALRRWSPRGRLLAPLVPLVHDHHWVGRRLGHIAQWLGQLVPKPGEEPAQLAFQVRPARRWVLVPALAIAILAKALAVPHGLEWWLGATAIPGGRWGATAIPGGRWLGPWLGRWLGTQAIPGR